LPIDKSGLAKDEEETLDQQADKIKSRVKVEATNIQRRMAIPNDGL